MGEYSRHKTSALGKFDDARFRTIDVRNVKRGVATVGNVEDVRAWSGIPFHFWKASKAVGFASEAWQLNLARVRLQRYAWNIWQLLCFRGLGGFQYSNWFLDLAEGQITDQMKSMEVISFNQHFPRASRILGLGGRISYFIDAPFVSLVEGYGLTKRLPRRVIGNAIALEKANYAAADRVITMARWAADVLLNQYGIPPSRVHIVLPGANLTLAAGWEFPKLSGRAGKERDFVLGFVGNNWRRKGLPFVVSVRDCLASRGWRVRVLVIGNAPTELRQNNGIDFAGHLDKRNKSETFNELLASCDMGCLFSDHEALGVSILEFLRCGVPVLGFAHEGMADTLPPDAGFRFTIMDSPEVISEQLETYLRDEAMQFRFRANAQRWSPLLTWERCVDELIELWTTGSVARPVRPWLGLPSSAT